MTFINNNGDDHTSGEEIGEILRSIPQSEYPRDKLTATKAEYTTHMRTMKKDKKSGCPLFILMFVMKVIGLIGVVSILG